MEYGEGGKKVQSLVRYVGLTLLAVIIVLIMHDLYNYLNQGQENDSLIIFSEYNAKYRRGDSPVNSDGVPIWVYIGSESHEWKDIKLPGKPPNLMKNGVLWMKIIIPECKCEDSVFLIRVPQQCFEVYTGKELVYKYGDMDFSNKKFAPGSTYHFIPLGNDYAQDAMYIRMYSPFTEYTGNISEIGIGSKSDLILNIIKDKWDYFAVSIIIIFIGICLIFFYFERKRNQNRMFMVGFSSISIGIWILAESRLINLFFDKPIFIMYIAYLAIFLMPIGFSAFIAHLFGSKGHYVLKDYWKIYFIFAPVVFLLEFTHVVSIFTSVKVFHIILAFNILIVVYTILKAAMEGYRDARTLAFGMITMSIAGIHDVVIMFYSSSQWLYTKKVTHWGTLIFIFSLLYIVVRRFIKLYDRLKRFSKERETNYRSLFENMTDGFAYGKVIPGSDGNPVDIIFLEMNYAFEQQIKIERKSVLGEKASEVFPDIIKSDNSWISTFGRAALFGEKLRFDKYVEYLKKWYDISVFSPRKDYFTVISSDITKRKKSEEFIRYQAFKDSVTGLYNRTYFEDVMNRINNELENFMPLSIISIDIDGLKIINDTLGHKMGDDLLKEAARIISKAFRSSDIVARVGGDEYCVILPNTENEIAYESKERIISLMKEFNFNNPFVPMSMSIGVATFKVEDKNVYGTFKRADDSMYQYKLSQSGSLKSKVIDMLLAALSERDYVAEGHIERLVSMVERLSSVLDITDAERRNLILLAKVHDLGKIGIPDEILFKPGKLTEEEYEKMKQHVKIGYNIANRSKELSNIAKLILYHHERWDGKGYLKGLKGIQIPIECRILSIVDSYDAMTSIRPYSKGVSKEEAIRELKKCSGTQFDPSLVEKFLEVESVPTTQI